jgi:hypothetical protein
MNLRCRVIKRWPSVISAARGLMCVLQLGAELLRSCRVGHAGGLVQLSSALSRAFGVAQMPAERGALRKYIARVQGCVRWRE